MVAGQQMPDVRVARPRRFLLQAGITLAAVALVSKVMTLAADSFVAARFGLTADADAYLLAIGLVGALIAAPSETLRLAIVPVCGRYLRQDNTRDAAGVIVFVLVGTVALGCVATVALAVGAPLLARAVAPGFGGEGMETLVLLLRVLAVGLVAGLVMAVLLGVLQTQLRFAGPALAGICLGASVIAMGLLLGGPFGVTSLAVGYVLGMLAVASLLAWMSRGVFRKGASLRNARRDMRPFLRLALPTGFAVSIVSLGAVIERAVASATGVGSVASLGFAVKLITQASMLSQSIWTPLTPLLTATGASMTSEGDSRLVPFSLKLVLLVVAPATALIIALRNPLVGAIFERGAFTAADTSSTARLLALHSGSLAGEGLFMVAVAALLSFHDSSTRLIASGLFISSKAGLMALLAPLMGVAGIALAASVSSLLAGAFAFRMLARRFAPGDIKALAVFAAKVALAGLLVLIVAASLSELVASWSGGSQSFATRVMQLALGAGGAAVAYVVALAALDVDEAKMALTSLQHRLGQAIGGGQ